MMNILPLCVYSHNSLSIFCHKFPFYNNCSCGWNCCSLCTGYWLALTVRAVLSSVHLNRQFVLISIGCQAIWGYQWNLLFDPLTQARSHCQVGWLSSLVNTFTPVPAISSIRPNHFPTCFRAYCVPTFFRANCSRKRLVFVIGPGRAPILHFLDWADLLLANLHVGKTNHKHFWMANWWYLLPNTAWLKCWTSLRGQKHFRFIKWFCVIVILAGGRIYSAINCTIQLVNTQLMNDVTMTWPSARMRQRQALQTGQK